MSNRLSILFTLLLLGLFSWGQPTSFRGELDVRTYDFSEGSFNLDGEWEFYWNQLYYPIDFQYPNQLQEAEYIPFMADWEEYVRPSSFLEPNYGYATYRLLLKYNENQPQLALYLPIFYSNYELYVNGRGIENNGKVGPDDQEAIPYWRPNNVTLDLRQGDNEIILLVSNFDHYKGGPYKPIVLGSAEQINLKRNFSVGASFFLAGCLLLAGILAFGLFWFNRTDYSSLFFFLFCVAYTYRALGTDEYVLHSAIGTLPWIVTLRLEYLSLYISVACYGYFLRNLVTTSIPDWVYHAVAGISLLGCISLFWEPSVFTHLIDYYLIFLASAMLLVAVWSLASMDFTHKMSWLTLLGAFFLAVVVLSKIGVHMKLISEYIWIDFIAYILFIFTQAIALIIRFGRNLRESTSAAMVATKSRAEFLNNMSHELRTPMNAILGMSEFLSKSELNATQKEKVSTIQKNAEALSAIILDILSMSELESGKIRLENQPLHLGQTVQAAITLALKERQNKPIELEVKIDEDLPEKLVSDPTRIKQIVMNVVGNAFKFTERGKVTVQVEMTNAREGQVEVELTVTDTGIGMSASKLKNLTKPFTQDDSSSTRRYGGTGLGLSVVKELLDVMKGSFELESVKNKGTTVRIGLPLELPKANLRDENYVSSREKGIDPNLKVLYAEDNPVNQKLLVMMMKTFGLDIDVAENGKVAWHKALEKNYNIILMDLQMPEMDGFEATRRIIEDVKTRPIIIAVTANASSADRKKCFEAGMNDFISKPIKADVLKQGIVKWQGLRRYLDEPDDRGKYLDIA